MKIEIRADSVYIEGYVNAVERYSKPLNSRLGKFLEKICSGAFTKALNRADDVRILLNHDWSKDLGGIKSGNLELVEDNIGLLARTTITDPETIEDARNGDLIGWSFGFEDVEDGVRASIDNDSGLPVRNVEDLNLFEVSLLNRKKTPAYNGTLVNVRAENVIYISEDYTSDEIEVNTIVTNNEADTIERDTAENIDPETSDKSQEVIEVSSEIIAGYKNIIAELKDLRDSVTN